MYASAKGKVKAITILVKGFQVNVDQQDDEGRTALYYACMEN